MLKIMLAEDLPSERETLARYIHRYAEDKGIQVSLDVFRDGRFLLEEYETERADLILLDIDMKYMDGITAAREIRKTDERVQIVFITRMVQHALEGYEVSAADYIVKPVSYELFAGKIDRVLHRAALETAERSDCITVKTQQGQRFLSARDILYAETSGKHVRLHVSGAVSDPGSWTGLETALPLYQLEKQLKPFHFFRCHSAFLVNLHYVTGYSQTDVFIGRNRTENDQELLQIPLSKHRRRDFINALMEYHINR